MKVYLLSTVSLGIDLCEMIRPWMPIAGVIGLSERPASDAISGYVYLAGYCADHGLDFIPVESYSLRAAADQAKLRAIPIDVLIVGGWQRLIPEWLIQQCRVGAIGIHGSAYGITGGRGRSPEGWALIVGQPSFSISIFRIDAGCDSGPVIATRAYPLSPMDDIHSASTQTLAHVADMLIECLCREPETLAGTPQSGVARYLPQRIPADGAIDWRRSAVELHDFVRALTRPYPGAFVESTDGTKLMIWRAIPLPTFPARNSHVPGTIIRLLSHDGRFLVQTGAGALCVTESSHEPSGAGGLVEGAVLPSTDFYRQMQEIFARHNRKHPDRPIQEDLIDFAERSRSSATTGLYQEQGR